MNDLESWLRKRNMKTTSFAELVPCSRVVIWKVKRNIAIDTKLAERIHQITEGQVKPLSHPRGVGKTRTIPHQLF